MKVIEVVAAVIFDSNNRIFVARRNHTKSLPGKWEFPGGKIEPGESKQEALERELFEEFGIVTRTREFIGSNRHSYGSFEINLFAYRAELTGGSFGFTDHDKTEWARLEDLPKYDLAEADIPLVHAIREFLNNSPM